MTHKSVLPAKEQALVYDTFPGMIWISGPEMQYHYFNQKWLDFRGRTSQQDRDWIRDIHPADINEFNKLIDESNYSHKPVQIKYRLKRYDGVFVWLLTNVVPQVDDNGTLTGYMGFSVDIQAQAEELTLRDDFISSATNELKIPVTTIKVYAQLLEDFFDRNGDEKHLNFLKKVNKQVVKLTRLINNLGESNKLYQSGIALEKTTFDFNKLLIEEISRAQAETTKHNIRFSGYTSQNVHGDREKLAQAFTNVLENAVKFSPEADSIEVTVIEHQDAFTVSVRDYGIGIDNKEIKNIFKRFYRVHDNTTNTFPGVGLGLYISSQIIAQHGGEIVCERGEPGSNFTFTLPYDNRT